MDKSKIEKLAAEVFQLIPDRLELRNDHVGAKPLTVDWRRINYEEAGDVYAEAMRCNDCDELVVVHGLQGDTEHRDLVRGKECPRCEGIGRHDIRPDTDDAKRAADELDEGEEGDGTVECALCEGTGEVTCMCEVPGTEGPMMNYLYPCDWKDIDEAAKALEHLPLIPVDHPDLGRGLALTGGGMDLSWEISAAYIALGFLPPAHFVSHLPNMGPTHVRQEVIDAGKVSLLLQAAWALRGVEDIDRLVENIRERAEREKARGA